MTIQEATKKAFDTSSCIFTPEMEGTIKIRPTNGDGNCIISYWDGSNPSKHGWQPRAYDFIRDDWRVTTEDQSPSQ